VLCRPAADVVGGAELLRLGRRSSQIVADADEPSSVVPLSPVVAAVLAR
jgi:hypothetical protein